LSWQYLAQTGAHGPQTDIIVGTPNTGTVSYEWATRLRTLNFPPGLTWGTAGYSGQPVDIARNIIVTNALRMQCRYLFFVDSDILLHPDTLISLHKHRQPVLSGTYLNRSPPYNIVAHLGKRSLTADTLQKRVPIDPIPVDEVGAGVLLIDSRVFYRLMEMQIVDDWYCIIDHNPKLEGKKEVAVFNSKEAIASNFLCPKCLDIRKESNVLLGNFFTYNIQRDKDEYEGEDYNFCKKVRKSGILVKLDLNVVVQHEVYRLLVDGNGIHSPNSPPTEAMRA